MPIFNRRGEWCSGIAGAGVYWQGGAVWLEAGGTHWLTDDEIIAQRFNGGRSRVEKYHVRNGASSEMLNIGALEIQTSGNGHWAILPPGQGPMDSFGRSYPGAALFSMGPDGSYVIKDDYFSSGPFSVIEPNGQRWTLTAGNATDIVNYGSGRLTWVEGGEPRGRHVQVPNPVARPFWWFRMVETPEGWFALYQLPDGRLVFHPANSHIGYEVARGETFGPDAFVSGNRVRFVWAIRAGEGFHEVRTRWIDLSESRQALGNPTPVPTPVPTPTPTPPEEPKMPWTPRMPNRTDVVQRLKDQLPQEWKDMNTLSLPIERRMKFIKRLASTLNQIDSNFGMNGKRGNVNDPSEDAIAYKNPTVDNGPEVADVVMSHGAPDARPGWINVTKDSQGWNADGVKEAEGGAGAVWVQPEPVGGEAPTPPAPPTPPSNELEKAQRKIRELEARIRELEGAGPTGGTYDQMMSMKEKALEAYGEGSLGKEQTQQKGKDHAMPSATVWHLAWRYLREGYTASQVIEDARKRGAGNVPS